MTGTFYTLGLVLIVLIGCAQQTTVESTDDTNAANTANKDVVSTPPSVDIVKQTEADVDLLAAPEMKRHAQPAAELGWQYFQRGDYETALNRFKMAIRHDPNFAPGYYGVAFVHSVQGELDDAIANYRKAIELDASHTYAHANLGYALLQQGKDVEALKMLEKALSLDPNCGEAHLSYANYYAKEEQWKNAGESALKAVNLGQRIHPELRRLLEAHGVAFAESDRPTTNEEN